MTDGRVEIVGDEVRRPRYPWTPTVHRVLAHLRAAGLTSVPAPLALDETRERVSLLPGLAGADCWPHQATERGLRSAARLLRAVHDATVGWTPPADLVWGRPPSAPAEILCHGDPGPWNMTWVGGEATGLFDWDYCHPGPRREDVAYALEYLAPFRDDTEAVRWLGFDRPPDRPRRVEVFCAAYGIDTDGIVDAVIEGQRRIIPHVAALAAAGVQPQVDWVAAGYLDELAARVAWSETHRELFGRFAG